MTVKRAELTLFLLPKLLCQPVSWRWLMFNTHFSWQHQKGTRQVKQIYLACFDASFEPTLKLFRARLPVLVCDFVTPITQHGRSIYLRVSFTPHIYSPVGQRGRRLVFLSPWNCDEGKMEKWRFAVKETTCCPLLCLRIVSQCLCQVLKRHQFNVITVLCAFVC